MRVRGDYHAVQRVHQLRCHAAQSVIVSVLNRMIVLPRMPFRTQDQASKRADCAGKEAVSPRLSLVSRNSTGASCVSPCVCSCVCAGCVCAGCVCTGACCTLHGPRPGHLGHRHTTTGAARSTGPQARKLQDTLIHANSSSPAPLGIMGPPSCARPSHAPRPDSGPTATGPRLTYSSAWRHET